MTPEPWDDERLAAAFRARFDRGAPPTQIGAIHGAIAGTRPSRWAWFGRQSPTRTVVAAALVVVAVGATLVGLGGLGQPPDGTSRGPIGSSLAASPTAGIRPPATDEPGQPTSVFGLDVMTVSDALRIRDAGHDDRELAVAGWFTPAPLISCGTISTDAAVSPVELRCPDQLVWLTERPEVLVHRTATTMDTSEPTGPALNPDLDGLDMGTQGPVGGPNDVGEGDSTPISAVMVGHFDDRRSQSCPAALVADCRDRFVVDAVPKLEGRPALSPIPPRMSLIEGGASLTPSVVERVIAEESPGSSILSVVIVDGQGLPAIEPSLADGQQGLTTRPVLWVLRVLESEQIATYIVVDGSSAIYEMTQEGDAVLVRGATGDPVETPGPWPPDDGVLIALTSPVGVNFPPVQVAVVDESSRLLKVTEKGSVNYSTTPSDGRFSAYAEPRMPGRVHLTWVGGICDSHITVTVAADLRTITYDMGPQPDCDTIGVGRELVLDFEGSVDVAGIEIRDAADVTKGSPAYNLECGPLGPDTCHQRASEVIAANLKGSPTNRVVSITFGDECGSYRATFDDGTGTAAYVDCFLP